MRINFTNMLSLIVKLKFNLMLQGTVVLVTGATYHRKSFRTRFTVVAGVLYSPQYLLLTSDTVQLYYLSQVSQILHLS